MKPESKGKIFIALVISLVAFGFGTGAGIFVGNYPMTNSSFLNLTKQGEFPALYSEPLNSTLINNSQPATTTPNEQVYQEPANPTNPVKNSSNSSNSSNKTGIL